MKKIQVKTLTILWSLLLTFSSVFAEELTLPEGVGLLGDAMVLENYPRSGPFKVREIITERECPI